MGLFPIQDFPQSLRKVVHVERFLDETITSSIQYFGRLSVDAVPAGKEDFDLGIDFFEAVIGGASIHVRHNHVQDYDIDVYTFFLVKINIT